jgi:Sigma-70, region 4
MQEGGTPDFVSCLAT